jgi:hypothetical protein
MRDSGCIRGSIDIRSTARFLTSTTVSQSYKITNDRSGNLRFLKYTDLSKGICKLVFTVTRLLLQYYRATV